MQRCRAELFATMLDRAGADGRLQSVSMNGAAQTNARRVQPTTSRPWPMIHALRAELSRENGLASPELLASRISVTPRRGAVTIIDDDALSATPNCQTIGSPL